MTGSKGDREKKRSEILEGSEKIEKEDLEMRKGEGVPTSQGGGEERTQRERDSGGETRKNKLGGQFIPSCLQGEH